MSSYLIDIQSSIVRDYESFITKQYHLTHEGLWFDGDSYSAVVGELRDHSISTDQLKELYEEIRIVGNPPIKFLPRPLKGSKKIDVRSVLERIFLHGEPLNYQELRNELSLHLPRSLHPFHVEYDHPKKVILFTFKNEISQEEFSEVEIACGNLGLMYPAAYKINSDMMDYPGVEKTEPNTPNNMHLVTTPYLSKKTPSNIIQALEEDEDYWIDNKEHIFSSLSMNREDILTDSFKSKNTSCFVDASVFPRQNIRQYMSLYERIIIAIPFKDRFSEFFNNFQFKKYELIELIKRGRIQFVIPQNIVRYDVSFISEILEVNPKSIIFSRRLAASSLVEIRKRTGLFCHSFSSAEKYALLNSISKSDNDTLQLLAADLSSRWHYSESVINNQGACGVTYSGIAPFVSKLFESRGRDVTIEILSAAMPFEWALGLGASYFPLDGDDYSEVNAARVLASAYSGFRINDPTLAEAQLENIIGEILTISNKMPVLELDDILASNDINRLSTFVEEFIGLEEDEFKMKVYDYNREIKRLEKNEKRLASMGVNGFISATAGIISQDPYVGFLTWVVGAIGSRFTHSRFSQTEIFDSLIALNNRTDKDIVLVSRIRRSLP